MAHRNFQQRLDGAESGAVLVFVALLIGVFIICVALAIDIGIGRVETRRIQNAVDTAALAGVDILEDPVLATDMAKKIANANGLSDSELAAGGVIETGKWDYITRTFSPLGLLDTAYNALRVRAKRVVPVHFAQVIGFQTLLPFVESVAVRGPTSRIECPIPFGIEYSKLFDPQDNSPYHYGDQLVLQGKEDAGNWGKLDLRCDLINVESPPPNPPPGKGGGKEKDNPDTGGGTAMTDGSGAVCNMSSGKNFVDAVTNRTTCPYPLSIGDDTKESDDTKNAGTGFAGIVEAFKYLLDHALVFPIAVVDDFPTGNSDHVTIDHFINVEVISITGNGVNWELTLRLLEQSVGPGTTGEDPTEPFALTRALVK